jgi:hypothetical protein
LKEYITVKEVFLLEQNLTFVIEKINRFDKNIINEIIPFYERINFIN